MLLSINFLTSQSVIARDWERLSWEELYWSEKATLIATCTAMGAAAAGTVVVVTIYGPILVPLAVASAKTGATVVAAKATAATAAIKAAGGTAIVYTADVAHKTYVVIEPVIQGAAAVSYITAPLSTAIYIAQLTQPYIAPTEKEKLQQNIQRNFETYKQAEKELITCMDKHAYPNTTIVPKICEEAALKYYFHATGKDYFKELMVAK